MTGTATGRWIGVTLRDGSTRYDWVPDDQPPSPDGTPGRWHVVGQSGEPGRWEWRESRAVAAPTLPFAMRPLVMSYRTAIVAVVAALGLLAVVVGVFTVAGRDDAPGSRANLSAPSLEFPMQSGPWTLYAVTVDRESGTGAFKGHATIGYSGSDSAAKAHVTIGVFRAMHTIGELTGTTKEVKRGAYTTVDLTSEDDWLPQADGFAFVAD